MSNEHQLPSDSDEDDEDYVPEGIDNELSEAESEGEAESGPEDENDENKQQKSTKKNKRMIKGKKSKNTKLKTKIEIKTNEEEEEEEEEEEKEGIENVKKQLTEEEEKKRADSLWADFMKDTGIKPKPKLPISTNGSQEKSSSLQKPKVEEKVKITKIFEFAGEEVKVEKEVSVDSAEARLSLSSAENSTKSTNPDSDGKLSSQGKGFKRGGLGGISSVLGQIGKKAKISTLEKSKLDWESYKKQEDIEEEISTHNKGKDGYLERQDFLQRSDLRRFEIEKQLRNTNRRSAR